MPAITIKGLPPDLLGRLRASAKRNRRSLNREAIFLLERALGGAAESAAGPEAGSQVEAWRRLAGRWVSDRSAEEEAREIYRRRTKGRDVDL